MTYTFKNYITQSSLTKRRGVKKYLHILNSAIKNPIKIIEGIISLSPIRQIVPDRLYISIEYRAQTGLQLNLDKPVRFNEKIQRLKLDKLTERYSEFADKYEVRKFVTELIGKEHLIPLIKVYDSVEEIDFSELPAQFVLKCTRDSGNAIICMDKSRLDITETKKALRRQIAHNYFYEHRELQYKNIKPRIICEAFLSEAGYETPPDFKIFCFNGVPKYIQVDLDRFENHKRLIYDLNWNKAPFNIHYPLSDLEVERPDNLHEMLSIAARLSQGFKFIRIDLYSVKGKVYFGELTFFHGAGYEKFYPDEYDLKWGELINLSNDL